MEQKQMKSLTMPEKLKPNLKEKEVSNFYFKKLKTIEICNLCLTFSIIGNSIVIYEIDYANSTGEYDTDVQIQLWTSVFINALLLITLNY